MKISSSLADPTAMKRTVMYLQKQDEPDARVSNIHKPDTSTNLELLIFNDSVPETRMAFHKLWFQNSEVEKKYIRYKYGKHYIQQKTFALFILLAILAIAPVVLYQNKGHEYWYLGFIAVSFQFSSGVVGLIVLFIPRAKRIWELATAQIAFWFTLILAASEPFTEVLQRRHDSSLSFLLLLYYCFLNLRPVCVLFSVFLTCIGARFIVAFPLAFFHLRDWNFVSVWLMVLEVTTINIVFFTTMCLDEMVTRQSFIKQMFLEHYTKKGKFESERARQLLHNLLPKSVVRRMSTGKTRIVDSFHEGSILFSDIKNFTQWSSKRRSSEVINMLNAHFWYVCDITDDPITHLFSAFDELCDEFGLQKGDAYCCMAGVHESSEIENHALAMCEMGLKMHQLVKTINETMGYDLQLRIGVHTGPIIGGIVGNRKVLYDIFGPTYREVEQLESDGVPDQVHISEATKKYIERSQSHGLSFNQRRQQETAEATETAETEIEIGFEFPPKTAQPSFIVRQKDLTRSSSQHSNTPTPFSADEADSALSRIFSASSMLIFERSDNIALSKFDKVRFLRWFKEKDTERQYRRFRSLWWLPYQWVIMLLGVLATAAFATSYIYYYSKDPGVVLGFVSSGTLATAALLLSVVSQHNSPWHLW